MTTTQNDFFAAAQKNFYPRKDFRVLSTQDSTSKKPCNPYGFPTQSSEKSSFIADWQMPTLEKHDSA